MKPYHNPAQGTAKVAGCKAPVCEAPVCLGLSKEKAQRGGW